jgi:hypothetical protein
MRITKINIEQSKFVTSVKQQLPGYSKPQYTEIFLNPTSQEMKSVLVDPEEPDVRFLIYGSTKDIYIFDGQLLHDYAYEKIARFKEECLYGFGKLIGTKIINPIFDLESRRLSPYFKFDLSNESWLHKWIHH